MGVFMYLRFIFDRNIKIGRRSRISWSVLIKNSQGDIKLGNYFHAKRNTTIHAVGGSINIDNNCFINESCEIVSMKRILIGKNCKIGPGVYIYDHNHGIFDRENYSKEEIIIGDNVWIGANAVILKGSHIGDNCIIGASSIISGIIEDNCIVHNNNKLIIKSIIKGEE